MKKILVIDDEPMFLDWLDDFSASLNASVEFITSIGEANKKIETVGLSDYAALIVDLNVPASPELEDTIKQRSEVFHEFRGLFIAQQARTKGMQGKKIIVYSVHEKPEIEEVCRQLDVCYIPKGRAKMLKDRLSFIVAGSQKK